MSPAWLYRTSAFHDQQLRNKIYERTKCCKSPTERELIVYFDKFRVTMNDVRRTAGVERNFPPTTTRICLPAWHYFLFSCHLRNNLRRAARNEHGEWSYPTREKTAWGCLIGGEGCRRGGETLNRCNSFSRTSAKPSADTGLSILITFPSPFEPQTSVVAFFSCLDHSTRARLFVACEISPRIKSPPILRNHFFVVTRNRALMPVSFPIR